MLELYPGGLGRPCAISTMRGYGHVISLSSFTSYVNDAVPNNRKRLFSKLTARMQNFQKECSNDLLPHATSMTRNILTSCLRILVKREVRHVFISDVPALRRALKRRCAAVFQIICFFVLSISLHRYRFDAILGRKGAVAFAPGSPANEFRSENSPRAFFLILHESLVCR